MDISTLKSNIIHTPSEGTVYTFGNGVFLRICTERINGYRYYRMYKSSDLGKTWSKIYDSDSYVYTFVGFIDENNALLHYNWVKGYSKESLKKITFDGTITDISGFPTYGQTPDYYNGYLFLYIGQRSFSMYKYNNDTQSVSFEEEIEGYKNLRKWTLLGSFKNEITGQLFVYYIKTGDGESTYIYQIGVPDETHSYIIYKKQISVYQPSSFSMAWEKTNKMVVEDVYIYFFSDSYAWRIPKNSTTTDEVEFLGGCGRITTGGTFICAARKIKTVRYIPMTNHSGLNLYAIIEEYNVTSGNLLKTALCELQSFQKGVEVSYRTIGTLSSSYTSYFSRFLYNGQYIWIGKTTDVDTGIENCNVVAGTTELNTFSIFNETNYFPTIYAFSENIKQFFYALTSNITISSEIFIIDKNNMKKNLIKFNCINNSALSIIKNNWENLSSNFLVFYKNKEELLLTSDSINYPSQLKVNNLKVFYK